MAKKDKAKEAYLWACESFVVAYEKGDEKNGGGGAVDWSDLDQAFNLAKAALKNHAPTRLKAAIKTAREENGV